MCREATTITNRLYLAHREPGVDDAFLPSPHDDSD